MIIDIGNRLPVEETLRRARKCIGKRGYNLAAFNCNHFAYWCKTGKYRSIQVTQVKTVLRELDHPLADVIVETVELEEMRQAQRLDPGQVKEIVDTIETTKYTTDLVITRRSLRSLRALREDFFCVS